MNCIMKSKESKVLYFGQAVFSLRQFHFLHVLQCSAIFSQLIEYNMINIFHKKSYIKCGGEASPRHFCKKSKLSISLDQQSKML